MAGRAFMIRAEPGFSLPAFDRLAPPPPPELVAARIDAHTAAGDVVVDLHGRGAWVARAAVDRQRAAVSFEATPLNRLLAEIVLRPPDVRHLDAAFQALSAAPRRETSLKLSISDLYATRCATCGRSLVVDEVIREAADDEPWGRPIRKHYRCPVCRDQLGGGEQRHAPLEKDDEERARWDDELPATLTRLRDRFPVPEGGDALVGDILALHTPRQLISLLAILERIDADLRAEPVEAALRLSLLHALIPASRLNTMPGRGSALRISSGRVRLPGAGQWRERNPWLAFEDAFRLVRGFVHRLEGSASGPVQARLGEDMRSLVEGSATVSVRVGTPSAFRGLAAEARELGRTGMAGRPRVRLVLGQPPVRPNPERLAFGYVGTAWVLGREAASMLPVEPLFDSAVRAPWAWQAAAVRRALESVEPVLARDGRAILLVDAGGPEALVAGALGGVAAGYRILTAHLSEPDSELGGVLEFVPPGAVLPPGPLTRANQSLSPVPGGAGDPDIVPGSGMFAPPERFDQRPFSPTEAARTVTEVAVAVLRARGEPARTERLVGEILVGLDRAGHLRRLTAAAGEGPGPDPLLMTSDPVSEPDEEPSPPPSESEVARAEEAASPSGTRARTEAPAESGRSRRASAPTDPIDRLLTLIRDELGRDTNHRLVEIEPDRWWLGDREEVETAAAPLADRVEWAVYSLLSTAGPLAENAFLDRIASLFTGHDLPDEGLVRACLASYRSLASTPDGLITSDDLLRRSHEHSELLGLLADTGHRMGMSVWIGRREQARRLEGRSLAEKLDERELAAYLPAIARGPAEDVEAIDCIWYVRGRAVLCFEVEWTAMLAEPILRRHSRIPPDERLVRFLVVAPERTELVRYKLERSPLLREALERSNWHILKWDHLRSFAGLETPSLAELEPYLGLDPIVERTGDQMPLFDA
jgi:hypothetical protein